MRLWVKVPVPVQVCSLPPTSPVPSVHGGLPTAATDISSGVAAAQSVCGLRSGFASRPDPFQLYGCRARSSGGCSSPRNCLVLRKHSLFFQLLPSAGCPAPHLSSSLTLDKFASSQQACGLRACCRFGVLSFGELFIYPDLFQGLKSTRSC